MPLRQTLTSLWVNIIFNAIEANKNAKLWQNVGYTEYDPATPIWNTWEEAVADEDKI